MLVGDCMVLRAKPRTWKTLFLLLVLQTPAKSLGKLVPVHFVTLKDYNNDNSLCNVFRIYPSLLELGLLLLNFYGVIYMKMY